MMCRHQKIVFTSLGTSGKGIFLCIFMLLSAKPIINCVKTAGVKSTNVQLLKSIGHWIFNPCAYTINQKTAQPNDSIIAGIITE